MSDKKEVTIEELIPILFPNTHKECKNPICQLWESHNDDGSSHCVLCWEDWPCEDSAK